MRLVRFSTLVLALAELISAATVAQIGTDEMAQKATSIVRAKVLSTRGQFTGSMIYTMYRVQVAEVWKGSATSELEVAVPGGVANGLRQVVAGSPALESGSEYVLFIWSGKSGLNQLIGLSQGALTIKGEIAMRAGGEEQMVDPKTGALVNDQGVKVKLSDLRSIVERNKNKSTPARGNLQ
jgi:hypothetical protein